MFETATFCSISAKVIVARMRLVFRRFDLGGAASNSVARVDERDLGDVVVGNIPYDAISSKSVQRLGMTEQRNVMKAVEN